MYSVIDIESNGAGYREESIIDIAIYKFDGHQVADQFISLVNPQAEITPFVQKLTSITPKMVRTAPKFHEIAKRIVEITSGTTLVGHNIDFDYRMLRQEFKRLGYDFTINTLDTIELSKKLIPNAESYSLGKLTKSLGIPLYNAHRAESDARATMELLKLLIAKDTKKTIIQQLQEENKTKTYLNKVKVLTQDIPSKRGIVFFQNEKGNILYSEYGKDMNRLAKKIFNSKIKKLAPIQQNTSQIQYELVGNSLLAQLILTSRKLFINKKSSYGLYKKDGELNVYKISTMHDSYPYLEFSTLSQGQKALSYIHSSDWQHNIEFLNSYFSNSTYSRIFTMEGRSIGEKAFFVLRQNSITGFGFYEFQSQISSWERINKRIIPITVPLNEVENSLKLSLLQGEIKEIDTQTL